MFKNWLKVLVTALALSTFAGPSQAALQAVDPGPYTAATGFFPIWYQDTVGTSLDLCLSKAQSSRVPGAPGAPTYMCTLLANLGPPVVFDDTLPIVFPLNFPDEGFYFTADANVVGAGVDLNYVAHLEAAFGGPQGLPAPGDQITFARIRIVPRNLPVAGTYTITHPYGVETITVTTPGRQTQVTRDIGIGAPGVFTGALAGDIGPFLQSVNGPYTEINPDTLAPETYVGDPNLLEQVTGGPNGNIVRVQGPGIDVQTDLFSISGRVWNGQQPTALAVDRSTYSRTATSASVDVFANTSSTATVSFRETLALGTEFPMTGDAVGSFFAADPAPTALPSFVVVTAEDPNGATPTTPTSLASPLVDLVTISRAVYARDSGTLIVEARSSDEVEVPTLNVLGFATPLDAAVSPQRLLVSAVAEPPASVTVVSSHGGRDTEAVVVTSTFNLAPVAVDDTATTDVDTPVTITVLANDSDPDNNLPLVVANLTAPSGGGTATVNPDQTVRFAPAAGFTGTDTFTYQAQDALGALSNVATVTVNVRPGNQAPVAVDDAATTAEDSPVSIDVLANDTDADGDSLVVSAVTDGANGSVVNNGTNVTYTPNPNFNGADGFTYTISDGRGGTATAAVTVTVTAVNDAPVANPDAATTAEDTAVAIPLASLLANDTDADGDALTVTAVGGPINGTVAIAGTDAVFTPVLNFNGAARFTYTVSDGNGGTVTGTVAVTVTPVNDPPVAVADTATTSQATAVTINVLANDTDVDGDALTVSAVTNGANGTVTTNGTNVTYAPNAGFSGTDSFSYTVSDGNGGTATATVTVTVTPVAAGLDLDIQRFQTTGIVRVSRNQSVAISLTVRNNSLVNGSVPATVVGVQNGATVYSRTVQISDAPRGGTTAFTFPSYTPTVTGAITWTVSFVDGNPDVDQATATTRVRP